MNFKDGFAKLTTTFHLCHYVSLNGYLVLAVDRAPQGNLSGCCGLQTEVEFDGVTIYDALRCDDPAPLEGVIIDSPLPLAF